MALLPPWEVPEAYAYADQRGTKEELSLASVLLVGSHKERVRYNGKLVSDGKEIKAAASDYNKLVEAVKQYASDAGRSIVERAEVSYEQILAADFPWIDERREGIFLFVSHLEL